MKKSAKSLTFCLKIITHGRERMFFDERTGKATTSIHATSLPMGTTLVLKRDERTIAHAEVGVLRESLHFQMFQGMSPLVRREKTQEDTDRFNSEKKRHTAPRAIHARTKGVCIGDILVITLIPQGLVDPFGRERSLEQWRHSLATLSPSEALKARQLECAEAEIYWLLGYRLAARFLKNHDGKTPSQLLRLAKELANKILKASRQRRR